MSAHNTALPTLQDLKNCLSRDRPALRKRIRKLRQDSQRGKLQKDALQSCMVAIQRSSERVALRKKNCPSLRYAEDLPITQRLQDIAGVLNTRQVVVVCGETGSGKSTQLPKLCLELGYGISGRIAHTQPRRVAARALAQRIAQELGSQPGAAVGYKVRFQDRVSDSTYIKLLTDGMLLAELQADRYLNEYDLIIIDEAHERSLNIDFLLGYMKWLLSRRPELKLIITSATIDSEHFSEHFDQAPVINVSGRSWPVETRYREGIEASDERDDEVQNAIIEAVDELQAEGRGDILIFLSGEKEIRHTTETLRKHHMNKTELLPLYARLSVAEQQRVFQAHGRQRIVLATNVAETSLTVPGIRYVIDPGFARVSRYSARSKVQALQVEPVSQASANQRLGRCGRTSAGICIRLYGEENFSKRREFTDPEIRRTHLAAVILRMKIHRLVAIEKFPFLDPPDQRQINDGMRLLHELGALNQQDHLSRLGKEMAHLPLDPRLARMLIEAARRHCLRELLVIVSALSIMDPRDRPLEKQQAADEVHRRFAQDDSDFMSYLKLWQYVREQNRHLSQNKFRKLCAAEFLSYTRLREWFDLHQQLHSQMLQQGYKENQADADYSEIHQSILSGLISNIGKLSKEKDFQGIRGKRFHIFPGSVLAAKKPKWLMAAERVSSSKEWGRTVARIQPEWIMHAAGDLLQYSYFEAHWQAAIGHVAAYRKTSLYGLVLQARQRLAYGPINAEEARKIFIREGLVALDVSTRLPFYRHNRELIQSLQDQEARLRVRESLLDEERLYQFYDQRIPPRLNNTKQLQQWLKGLPKPEQKILHMQWSDVCPLQADENMDEQFPEQMELEGVALPLRYHFEPGQPDDGVTLKIPVSLLPQVSGEPAEWLVPGLLLEKITRLMRLLPKAIRRQLVPVPDTAAACLAHLQAGQGSLSVALSEALSELKGIRVSASDWDEAALPDYLRMNFEVLDESGKPLQSAKNLPELRKKFQHWKAARQAPASIERSGITCWDFDPLPQKLSIARSGLSLNAWPALVDDGQSVSLRLFESQREAQKLHRRGMTRLFSLALGKWGRQLKKDIAGLAAMQLAYALVPGGNAAGKTDLQDELFMLAVEQAFIPTAALPANAEEFEQALQSGRPKVSACLLQLSQDMAAILKQYQRVRAQISKMTQIHWKKSIEDVQQQLSLLIYRGFLQHYGAAERKHLLRYLAAISKRLEKLPHALARDEQHMKEMSALQQRWNERYRQQLDAGGRDERLQAIFQDIQELRVSLFAQELGTARPVSVKRIMKHWQALSL
ncbi:MAG: ATP-dependent RNA helicase HrpA [gamma proteobacterium symbiont of Bathyaustriella thionipta]|nr:ATP-dependent RNA helicase HrpA [gamma proteobacterium symbiont of Bathyaustriella thionipta]